MVETWDGYFDAAFRYSFVPSGGIMPGNWPQLLMGSLYADELNLSVVVGWIFHDSGPHRIKSKFIERALKKEGWEVAISEGIGLATRPVMNTGSLTVPDGCERMLQGRFFVMGKAWALLDFCRPPLLPSIRHFCVMQRLQPSVEFFEEIVAREIFIMYQSTVSDSRSGLVLMGPKSRTPNLEQSLVDLQISNVFWDADAPRVWSGSE